jgi:hypothetical protein
MLRFLSCFCLVLLLSSQHVHGRESLPLIVLRVHVHLMRSVANSRLQSNLSEKDVRAIFDEVNVIWSQAGIRFELEAIDSLRALNVAPKRWHMKDRDWVKAAIPTAQFSRTAIDVCFVKEMGPNGFFYGEPVVVSETPELHKVKGGSAIPVARVTAHELGHVLFLQHRQERTNLMASGKNGVSLNPKEINDARKRALEILVQTPRR